MPNIPRRRRSLTAVAAALLAAAAFAGCPDDGGGNTSCTGDFCLEDAPQLGLQPGEAIIEIVDSGMLPGEEATRTIRIINTGVGALDVRAITLDYRAPATAPDGDTPAFQLDPLPVSLPTEIFPLGGLDFPQGIDILVRYTKQDDTTPRNATLTFRSNDIANPIQQLTLTTDTGLPRLNATPSPLDFGLVPKDTISEKTLTLLNPGTRALFVNGFKIISDGRFGVKGPGFDVTGPEAVSGIDLDTAVRVPAGESVPITVYFESDSPSPAEADLRIFSDDPTSGVDGFVVPIIANRSGPCITVSPRFVAFGGKLVGSTNRISVELSSCGTEPVKITSLTFAGGSSPDFTIDYSSLPAPFDVNGPSPANPMSIPINTSVTVDIVFVPDAINPRDADNVPIPDMGTLLVASDAFENEIRVAVTGAGAESDCPEPVIVVREGEEVIPQTVLHLDGTESYAAFGAITAWNWSIEDAPDGNTSLMLPSFTDPEPLIEVNLVGTYTFKLDVVDETGKRSGIGECPSARYTVLVQPDQAIHVELSWVTPGDPDETDVGEGVGSDLDLHFAHQAATGPDLDGDNFPDPWFDKTWDCFWYNQQPNWASFDPNANDDPSLDRDDTDGGGPENLNLSIPEDGVTYQIAVHYWNDWGLGPADATVKVFHYAELVYEVSHAGLESLDMWCVGNIHWPTPVVERCAQMGMPEKITPDYRNYFFQPPVF